MGIVQGLTEFLPVSSSGHLVLIQKLAGLDEGVLTFDIAVHLATLISVIIVLRQDVMAILKKPLSKLTFLIIAASIPTAIIGFVFRDTFQKLYETGVSTGLEFIFTGLVLWIADGISRPGKGRQFGEIGYIDAILIGTAQGIAILPAVSRSGLTLAGGLARGLKREAAIRFSFLLSIPAILGPALLDGMKLVRNNEVALAGGLPSVPVLLGGMLAAGVAGYFAIKLLLGYFAKVGLKGFAYYVAALGVLILADQFFTNWFFPPLF